MAHQPLTESRRPAASAVEAALWVIAVLSLGYVTTIVGARTVTSHRLGARLDAMRAQSRTTLRSEEVVLAPVDGAFAPGGRAAAAAPAEGDLVGRIKVARLGIDAIVIEGSTAAILDVAVGHLPGTALPGHEGRVVLTAHRDSFFRPLREVAKGDEILLETPTDDHRYEVVSTEIVLPTELRVLEATSPREIALVTCYPFHYVGSAPKRYVVHGREIPDARTAQTRGGVTETARN